mmetsp:Transcript_32887/g.78548  ORF Transcript_32887/g.78548 Transcript_32887/m.78548 type:complete len:271 (+) Transcript_32887:2032-2844(+)
MMAARGRRARRTTAARARTTSWPIAGRAPSPPATTRHARRALSASRRSSVPHRPGWGWGCTPPPSPSPLTRRPKRRKRRKTTSRRAFWTSSSGDNSNHPRRTSRRPPRRLSCRSSTTSRPRRKTAPTARPPPTRSLVAASPTRPSSATVPATQRAPTTRPLAATTSATAATRAAIAQVTSGAISRPRTTSRATDRSGSTASIRRILTSTSRGVGPKGGGLATAGAIPTSTRPSVAGTGGIAVGRRATTRWGTSSAAWVPATRNTTAGIRT